MGGIGSIQAYDPALLVDESLRRDIELRSTHLEVGDKADVRLLSWGYIQPQATHEEVTSIGHI